MIGRILRAELPEFRHRPNEATITRHGACGKIHARYSKRYSNVNWEAVARHSECPPHLDLFVAYIMGGKTIDQLSAISRIPPSVLRGVTFQRIVNTLPRILMEERDVV